MEGKKSFLFYADWQEIFESLGDKDCAELIRHIMRYVNDEDPETDNPIVQVAFIQIKNTLKRDLEHWTDIKKKRSDSGKKGGRPKQSKAKKPNALFDKQSKAKKAVSVSVSVNDSVSDSVTATVKDNIPTYKDFLEYAKTIEIYHPDYDYSIKAKYEAWKEDKWRDGNGNEIKNWKTKLMNTLPHLKKVRTPDTPTIPRDPLKKYG